MDTIITEAGDSLMLETVAGVSGASTLNDVSVQDIQKETFGTDPLSRGWYYGADWVWDSVNLRMKMA